MRIDLHTHSGVSDGTDTPAELVTAAAAAGLDVVALTDHDTTAGWAAAADALPPGLRLVPGAEFSCTSLDGRGQEVNVHLLGYLFDPQHPAVVSEAVRLRRERRRRLRRMAELLAADGYPVDASTLLGALPPDCPVGRPHLARALVDAGVVSSIDEAFARLLHSGGPYYVPRADTPVAVAIGMVRDAGGVAVLAHPFAAARGPVIDASVLGELAVLGLAGVEVDHPDHDAPNRARLRGLAGELGLLVTGSSDYHGRNKTSPIGAETTDPAVFDALVSLADGAHVIAG